MYDPRNILKQKPETVRDLLLTLLALLVALNIEPFKSVSAEATGLIGLLIYKALGVFYVEPQKKANTEEALVTIQSEVEKRVEERVEEVVASPAVVTVISGPLHDGPTPPYEEPDYDGPGA